MDIVVDERLKSKYHGLDGVVGFLDEASRASYYTLGFYPPFEELGINSVADYIELIENGDEKAISMYETLKSILGL